MDHCESLGILDHIIILSRSGEVFDTFCLGNMLKIANSDMEVSATGNCNSTLGALAIY